MSFEALNLFEQMQQPEIQWLLATAELVAVEAGDNILREGELPANIYLVADGQLEVSAYSGEGKVAKVGRLQPGDVIGEISWLDHKPVSGSVTATETGVVLRLPIATLEAKLAADPIFASHFMRGVATLLAERLRKTTIQLRGLAGTASVSEDNAVAARLAEIKEAVKNLEVQNGMAQAASAFHAALQALEREAASNSKTWAVGSAEALRQELRPIVARSAIGLRCVTKPRGYAGDFATQQMVYDAVPEGTDAAGVEVDRGLLDLAGLRGIRGRLHLAADALHADVDARSGPVRVTCLGAGAAPEVFALISDRMLASRLVVTCIDVDREAVAFLERKVKDGGSAAHVSVLHANLLHLATGRDELGLEPQHIMSCSGLFDALGDDAAVAVLNWSHDVLLPGGTIIVGSICPENSSEALLAEALDWRIAHRSKADLDRLFERSSFNTKAGSFTTDPRHPGFLAIATKA